MKRAPEAATMTVPAPLDHAAIAADFPILDRPVHGRRLVYLDNAATTQKPRRVIDAITRFYEETNGPVHRAVHELGGRSTEAYEDARRTVARFMGASGADEIVFVRGVTEAMNLLAFSLVETALGPGDEVLAPLSEHHSNLLPWRQACRRSGATLRVIPLTATGEIDLGAFDSMLGERTRVVTVAHVSNVLGAVNPVEEIIRRARRVGAITVVDGAQAACHTPIGVAALGCDFYAISGHKMYAPTGIGAIYGSRARWEALPPWQSGGSMVERVSLEDVSWARAPMRFEAGSPNAAGAVGLAAAVGWLDAVGLDRIAAHENAVARRALDGLRAIDGVTVHGPIEGRAPVISFTIEGAHPHDVATILDGDGVAVRAGHHCAQPLTEWLGVSATTRASFGVYNNLDDAEALLGGVRHAMDLLR